MAKRLKKKYSAKDKISKNPFAIKQIFAEKLFGYYTYSLPGIENPNDLSKLFILYGDNGSGKTTIIKALFYLLSTKDNAGFKSSLARIKFRKFSVLFENGLEIGAEREKSLIGDYNFYIKEEAKVVHEVCLKTNDDFTVSLPEGSPESKILRVMLNYVSDLNISIFFLADDRKFFNSYEGLINKSDDELGLKKVGSNFYYKRIVSRQSRRVFKSENIELDIALERFILWIKEKIISGSNTSEVTAINIYTDLVKNIDKIESAVPEKSKEDLLNTIIELSNKSVNYSKLGLISSHEYKEIINVLSGIKNSNKIELIYNIIKPYFNSLEARLSALEGLQTLLSNFIESVNMYFSRKSIEFNLTNGFRIIHEKGDELSFANLSSGERQLLLILINSITASAEATIFIIDEPEISLNIKWQRNLLKTLLDFNKDGRVQFVIATHSIELLAPNLNNVAKIAE